MRAYGSIGYVAAMVNRITAGALLLLLISCASAPARTLGEKLQDGRFTVDGVELKYSRRVKIEIPPGTPKFTYRTAVGSVECTEAASRAPGVVEFELYEIAPDDAAVSLVAGRMEARSRSSSPVGLGSIRGTIPAGTSSDWMSSSGSITLRDMTAPVDVTTATTSGNISVGAVALRSLAATTSSGSVRVEGVDIRILDAVSAAGPVDLIKSGFRDRVRVTTSTGAITLTSVEAGTAVITTADGQVTLDQCMMSTASVETSSGNIRAETSTFKVPPVLRAGRGTIYRSIWCIVK